jgi:hypothetical protein
VTDADTHALREVAQLAAGVDGIASADVIEDVRTGDPMVELTVRADVVGTDVLAFMANHDLALDPDRTATRGDPTHTVVVAR